MDAASAVCEIEARENRASFDYVGARGNCAVKLVLRDIDEGDPAPAVRRQRLYGGTGRGMRIRVESTARGFSTGVNRWSVTIFSTFWSRPSFPSCAARAVGPS